MTYQREIDRLKALSKREVEKRIRVLLEFCPSASWPTGMPGSLDPKLVVIGVSPGDSPDTSADKPKTISCPGTTPPNNFCYRDTRRYWDKVRQLSHRFISHNENGISESESLMLTSHFNLGTGSAGKASKGAVEKEYIQWVSKLLNRTISPDLVVLFGLGTILRDNEVSSWWNLEEGLSVHWGKPDLQIPFDAYKTRKLTYKQWSVTNDLGKSIRLVAWPNHPSRSPFTNFEIWEASVNEYVEKYESYA